MPLQSLKIVLLLAAGLLTAGPSTAAGWTPLGPFGGSVQTLTVDPGDARVLYATLGAQGAFKSADGGATWNPIHAGTAEGNVAVDPSRHGTLYLASGGVQKSTDGGAHWTDLGLKAYGIVAVAVDPARPSRLYAASSVNGVFRSADGGASWQPARQPLPAGSASHVTALAVPRTGGIVYAGTGAGAYKSVDGGLSWRPASQGLPSGAVLALAVAPTDPKTVYASVNNNSDQAVYRSIDGGASWRRTAGPPLPGPGPRGGSVLALAVSPASPRTVWAGTDPSGLFLTTDGGAHWTATGPQPARPVLSVAVAPSSSRTIYTGVLAQGFDLGGVFASADGGASWARRNQGLDGLDARALAVPPGNPGLLWAGLDPQGLFRSANAGRRWARVALPDPALTSIPLVDLELAPSDSSTLYALALRWLWRTTDGGAAWTEAYAPPSGPDLQFLRVDPADPFRLWGSSGFSPFGSSGIPLLRSTDGGETWNPAATPNLGCEVFDLQFAPSSPSTLYVAGAKSDTFSCKLTRASLFRSTDDGASWTEADASLNARSVTALAVDPVDPRLVYAGTGGDYYHQQGDGVWKSTDGGASWTRAGNGLAGKTITAVTASPAAGVVWAAVEGGQIFRSGDGGATWEDRTGGLQAFQVYRLEIDPADPRRVYAATSGGIWTLEDVP
jgi:photosystem II stability/assembly factor-like uncharacterized protein